VRGSFDIQSEKLEKRFSGSIPIEGDEDWRIGLIIGRSGTGKTSIAKELFKESYVNGFEWKSDSLVDDFPQGISVDEITKLLCNVGFASPPDWLKRYENLSQGEKMRVDIARAIADERDLIVFDEFTSVVDRQVAKVSCVAISKAIRKAPKRKRLIAVSCHYDIMEWLQPDWILSADNMQFEKKRSDITRLSSWRSSNAAKVSGMPLDRITI
jgi:ABC-type dipeptide/oligopeptide/nickel transport system ATPase subunit